VLPRSLVIWVKHYLCPGLQWQLLENDVMYMMSIGGTTYSLRSNVSLPGAAVEAGEHARSAKRKEGRIGDTG
jgi:hypothetical protein